MNGTPTFDADVAIVGGGPTGCAAGVFTARDDFETVIFDRGPSSLRRCASLENYLGFPCGIDVETFLELAHDHAVQAGCRVRRDLVEAVTVSTDGGFRIEPQTDETITARFVLAATKHGADYLRGLDSNEPLFVAEERDGETSQRFDPSCLDDDGRAPIDGLYVAGPLAGRGDQAIVAAGHGATVARTILRDVRRAEGYWSWFATRYDWVRRTTDLRDEWASADRWIARFEQDAPDDLEPATVERLAEAYAAEHVDAHVEPAVAADRAECGQRRLAETLDDDILLETVDDSTISEYAASLESSVESS